MPDDPVYIFYQNVVSSDYHFLLLLFNWLLVLFILFIFHQLFSCMLSHLTLDFFILRLHWGFQVGVGILIE